MFSLSELGFGSFFEQQLVNMPAADLLPARLAAEHRAGYEVWSVSGCGFAHLAGRLHQEPDEAKLPRVGDWVAVKSPPAPGHTTIIEHVFDRLSAFTRGAAGTEARGQVIAANVNVVFIVCGLDSDYSPRRIERYLARIWASGAQPVVILNKADLCTVVEARIQEVMDRSPGVPVHAMSALHSQGIAAIRSLIPIGHTAAFVGSSGAGKSTLINALVGTEQMATGELRASDGRGRHTTTHRQLVMLPGGGLLLDTPGIRELQLLDDDGIASAFPDIEERASHCRYRDCGHDTEPGCAVREAVAAGLLATERFEHYLKLTREAHAYELRHDAHLRHKAEREWKNLTKEGERIRRWKQGR